jgi:hypothetical protein
MFRIILCSLILSRIYLASSQLVYLIVAIWRTGAPPPPDQPYRTRQPDTPDVKHFPDVSRENSALIPPGRSGEKAHLVFVTYSLLPQIYPPPTAVQVNPKEQPLDAKSADSDRPNQGFWLVPVRVSLSRFMIPRSLFAVDVNTHC